MDCCKKRPRIICCSSLTPSSGDFWLILKTAFRWISLYQGLSVQIGWLQQGFMVPELHRFDCRCLCFPRCLSSARRYQDPYPKPKLRQPREWIQDCERHDETRGSYKFLQGTDTQGMRITRIPQTQYWLFTASHDRTKAGILLLACTDPDPSFRYHIV